MYKRGSSNIIQDFIKQEYDLSGISKNPEYLYILKVKGFNRYKIGHTTTEVKKRIGAIQTASPFEIEIICTANVNNGLEIERELHRQLAQYRIKGEWFQIDDPGMIESIIFFCSHVANEIN